MNAFLLIIPIFLIRFGLLKMINKDALSRAAFFAPLEAAKRLPTSFTSFQTLLLSYIHFF